jgi:hypothetical protein
MKLTLSFLLLAALASGQSSQWQDRTSGLYNGRFWVKLSQEQRKAYILGMLDQLLVSQNTEIVALRKMYDGVKGDGPTYGKVSAIGTEAAKSLPDTSGLNLAEMPANLDQFYSNADNRIVPIAEALRFSLKKAQGEEPAKLTKEIADRVAHWRQPGSGLN